ncbi:hypothetical protein WSM22_16150 [Cytophagales bacterium WSM2-2]|nr:hypothetical protein WSM22_16150 [Cytophagales bacterium WSM2-2]
MRKTQLIFFLLLVVQHLYAQEFRKFKFSAGGGITVAREGPQRNAGVFYLEPSYRVNNQVTIGLRFETTVANHQALQGTEDDFFSGINSYSINGQYYLRSSSSFRPFVGIGVGIFSTPTGSSYSYSEIRYTSNYVMTIEETKTLSSGSKFGLYPRVGFDIYHFSFTAEYNIGPTSNSDDKVIVDGMMSGYNTGDKSRDYLSFKVGFFLGGGKKTTAK